MLRWYWICLFLLNWTYSIAWKWVPSSIGDPIPLKAIHLNNDYQYNRPRVVGRARHFDEVFPAEIVNGEYAKIKSCENIIRKMRYEILIPDDDESCQWIPFVNFASFPIDAVPGGNAGNGEPLFIGFQNSTWSTDSSLAYIQFTTRDFLVYDNINGYDKYYLACHRNITWIDTSAKTLQPDAVSIGKKKKLYVARVKSGCSIIPGQVDTSAKIASAILENGTEVTREYAQVLIAENNNYTWIAVNNQEIPDNAIVAAQAYSGEYMYVARQNNKLGYVMHSQMLIENRPIYDILVKT